VGKIDVGLTMCVKRNLSSFSGLSLNELERRIAWHDRDCPPGGKFDDEIRRAAPNEKPQLIATRLRRGALGAYLWR
jgi:hypothetical protein